MSSSYFVTPYDPIAWLDGEPNPKPTSDLRIDSHDFTQKLEARWPGIKVYVDGSESNVALAWEFPLPSQIADNYGRAMGILFDNLQLVSLSKDYDGKFQGFYRSYIPVIHRLWFFHESSWERLELIQITTDDDIVAFRKNKISLAARLFDKEWVCPQK